MTGISAMVDQLRDEFDETINTGPQFATAIKTKKNRKTKVDVFTPPVSRSKSRTRIIAEVSSEIGDQFKDLCRLNGWAQRDVIERFLTEFVSRNC